jgi:TetR/AcrR family transcriptional regulator, transcriptional repressor for nem operon
LRLLQTKRIIKTGRYNLYKGAILVKSASKGEETRMRILRETAPLMNKRGFLSTPLADILKAVGLEKGGFYHHFASKEDLAIAAFEMSVQQVGEKFREALEGQAKGSAIAKLKALIEAYRECKGSRAMDSGGCPILNAAVESDDMLPRLRDAARLAVDRWRGIINRIIGEGIASGEIRADVHPDRAATWIIATTEGGVMLSNLYKDATYLNRVLDQIVDYVDSDLKSN